MNEKEYINELKFDTKRSRVKSCPCGKDNKDGKFAPYVGYENKGHCHSCGTTFFPEPTNDTPPITFLSKPFGGSQIKPKLKVNYISLETFKSFLGKDLESNSLVVYLISLFGSDTTRTLIERYYVSTSTHWNGATIFWQIDIDKRIRSGKILLYSSVTGKRDKTKNNWVHSVLKLTDFNLSQCFFGEHLLTDKSKVVAIVEGDKTAIIMSYYLPQYIWLSSSGKEGLNIAKFGALKGRTVILFPDLSKLDAKINCYELWCKKADEFKNIATITVSDYLERIATDSERLEGLDIADYFIKYASINQFEGTIQLENVEPVIHYSAPEALTAIAYVNGVGELFIETPFANTYTVYPSIEHYNKRLCLPEFLKKENLKIDSCATIHIDLKTLTINPN